MLSPTQKITASKTKPCAVCFVMRVCCVSGGSFWWLAGFEGDNGRMALKLADRIWVRMCCDLAEIRRPTKGHRRHQHAVAARAGAGA
jgi:hypothetical protein